MNDEEKLAKFIKERNLPLTEDQKELLRLYQGWEFSERARRIREGRELAVKEGRMHYHPKANINDEECKRLYLENGLSLGALGLYYKVHKITIRTHLVSMGVQIRQRRKKEEKTCM